MPPTWQERVAEEREHLNDNIYRLSAMMKDSKSWLQIPAIQRQLLAVQLHAMQSYSAVLSARLEVDKA